MKPILLPAASRAPAPFKRPPAPPALLARTAALLPMAIAPTASALQSCPDLCINVLAFSNVLNAKVFSLLKMVQVNDDLVINLRLKAFRTFPSRLCCILTSVLPHVLRSEPQKNFF